MAVAIGDKVYLINDNTGKTVVIKATAPGVGDKILHLDSDIPTTLRLSSPAIGDKVYILNTISGKDVMFKVSGWTEESTAGWCAREMHSFVTLSDDSIILMGGAQYIEPIFLNDVWKSTDKGKTWVQQTSSAGWCGREAFGAAVLSDDTIVIGGGQGNFGGGGANISYNDVWKSTDAGVNWTKIKDNAWGVQWSWRWGHQIVRMNDDSLVLIGGLQYSGLPSHEKHDVWHSTDGGASWHEHSTQAVWFDNKYAHCCVHLSDDSIVMVGCGTDVWRSTSYGESWVQQTSDNGFTSRVFGACVSLSSDKLLFMGGEQSASPYRMNDVHISLDSGASWSSTSNAPWSGREGHAATRLSDNKIIVTGGSIGPSVLNDVWLL